MSTFYLKANGDLYPCTALLHKSFRVGNVKEQPLKRLWNDPAMSAMANYPRSHLTGDCNGCDNFDRCRGACRGASFAHSGDLDASFPVCLYQASMTPAAG